MYRRIRLFQVFALATAMIVLTACAGRQPKEAATPVVDVAKSTKPDDRYGHRFHMTQHGKRMTADDFDAWLKAKGLHIRGGKVTRSAKGAKATKVASTAGVRSAGTGKTKASGKAGKADKATATAKAGATAKTNRMANTTARTSGTPKVAGAGMHKAKPKREKADVAVTATADRDG